MTEKRILNTKETATLLGLSCQAFCEKRKSGIIPLSPLPYCRTRFDRKAVEQFLDNLSNVKPELPNWKDRFLKAMNNGEDNRALPH